MAHRDGGHQCCKPGMSALILSGKLLVFVLHMVLMWGFILEVFWTSLNRIGLKFLVHLNSEKSLEFTNTGLLFPNGKGVGRARDNRIDSILPWWIGICSAPLRQQVLSLQDNMLSLLRLELFSFTLDCKLKSEPHTVQPRAGSRFNLILTTGQGSVMSAPYTQCCR